MKPEEFAEIVEKALTPFNQRLNELETTVKKSAEDTPDADGAGAADEPAVEALTAEQVSEIVKEAIAPLSTRLDTVEKARGISKSADADADVLENQEVRKSEEGVFDSLFKL